MYEQFIELLFELAKQSPTILLLGLAVYEFRRREMVAVEKLEKERKAMRKEMKELNEHHDSKLEKERNYTREQAEQALETLEAFKVHLLKDK